MFAVSRRRRRRNERSSATAAKALSSKDQGQGTSRELASQRLSQYCARRAVEWSLPQPPTFSANRFSPLPFFLLVVYTQMSGALLTGDYLPRLHRARVSLNARRRNKLVAQE